jgi:hypothetical protein
VAVCETLTNWLEDVQPHHLPTAITQHQHAIGFHLLHRGYICTDWTHRQNNHEPKTGHAWTRDLITFLWKAAYKLWTLCNSALHGPDNTLACHQDLKAAATILYELQDKTLAQDRHNFNILLTKSLAHSPRRLHNYIQAQAPVILHSITQAFQRATQESDASPTTSPLPMEDELELARFFTLVRMPAKLQTSMVLPVCRVV